MTDHIKIRGAREHNLKNVNLDIPKNSFVVITGLSGSGKSSLAFDTVYAEGQRRYVESLSAYARQFLQLQNKPDVDSISGLSPAIAIDQKTTSRNPRSTVGTITEVYDYLRLLYARVGIPYSPSTGLPIKSQTITQIVDELNNLPLGTRIYILSPLTRGEKGEHKKELLALRKQGFQRVKIDDKLFDLEEIPAIDKNKKHNIEVVIDRMIIDPEQDNNRLTGSVETALKIGDGLIYIEILDNIIYQNKEFGQGHKFMFSEKFCCPISGFQITDIEPRMFSFNSPFGACPSCEGLGKELFFDPDLIIPDCTLSLYDDAIVPWKSNKQKYHLQLLDSLAIHYKFSLHTPFEDLTKQTQQIILYGSGEEQITMTFNENFQTYKVSKVFEGVIPSLEKRLKHADANWIREDLAHYQSEQQCKECKGYRLRQESLCIKIAGFHIGEVSALRISKLAEWFKKLPKLLTSSQNIIAERVIKEISERLGFLNNVGLDYLTLSRESATLSGGESQRIRLASQIGSGLTGVLYVLDEPSIGLHPSDNSKLITSLKNLRNLGNTVIVVEHDSETMLEADYLIDIGPGAGIYGGQVVAEGTPAQVKTNDSSLTGQYLSGKKKIMLPITYRAGHSGKFIELTGVKTNNLQNVSMKMPLGVFCCVTGVSGGGKSSLVIHTLYKAAIKILEKAKTIPGEYEKISGLEYIDKIIEIDQSPIGRTPRSNPATYTGAFNAIRDWFGGLPESRARGYKPGRFSFNVKGGRCEACQGDGVIKIEMHFLPDVYVKCEECQGQRYNRATLEVKYKGKSIAEVLDMTVEDACGFFSNIPTAKDKLNALLEVGLGYIKIGQPATTLSGGEAQRVKLSKELAKRSTGRTLYILDEPTTGLHFDDIKKLLVVLHKLVDLGNTVLVIEHNLDVIKTADHVIDVGPGGGDKGGRIIALGTPQEIMKCSVSLTGKFLKSYIEQTENA